MSARYRVHAIPAATEEEGHCHFDVAGPDVNYFARQGELAGIMRRALNSPRGFTPGERRLLREIIGHALAGETYYSAAERKALERAQEKLS